MLDIELYAQEICNLVRQQRSIRNILICSVWQRVVAKAREIAGGLESWQRC